MLNVQNRCTVICILAFVLALPVLASSDSVIKDSVVSVVSKDNPLASGSSREIADSPLLRLCPDLEIACRFRVDKLKEGVQNLAVKDGEYMLRVDWQKEGGNLSLFVCIEGQWETRLRGPVVETGVWYDVRASWTGDSMTMEVNGTHYSTPRMGSINPGPNPLKIGSIDGEIAELAIRNPGLERLNQLSAESSGQAVSVEKPRFLKSVWDKFTDKKSGDSVQDGRITLGGSSGWEEWNTVDGANCVVKDGILTGTFQSCDAMLISPVLSDDITACPVISIDIESAPSDCTGRLDFITDKGSGTFSFKPQPGGRPVIINGMRYDAWSGTLKRVGLSFKGGSGDIAVRQIVLADCPVGKPSFYIRSFAAGRAKLRPHREETVIVGIQNVGGEAENISVQLSGPLCVKILGKKKQAVPYLGMNDFDMVTWRVKARRAGKFTLRVDVESEGSEKSSRKLVFVVDPLPDLPESSYVPEPRPAKTDYINLMHYCALWKEGTHWGWKRIEPWPERRPAIGFYDEGTPEVADWHIKYALEHGINGFIYCWYRADYEPVITHRLGHAIHDGLYKARYCDKFTFTIMWENGCAKGVKDEADLLNNLMPFWMENYFKHPSYLKIDNQPVFFVWQPRKLLADLGGPEKTKQALEKMREYCRNAGFKGLRIIACLDSLNPALAKQIGESGWDAVSGYNLSTDAKPVGLDPAGLAYRDHADVLSRYKQIWIDRDASTGDTPDIPNVVMGRDDRAWGRIKPGKGSYIADPEASNFEKACRDAKALVDAKPAGRWDRKIVVFDNWTEFGEGHYIEPTTGTGFTFVNAIKRVFCTDWAPEELTDIIPEDLGMSPPQKRYEEVRAGFGDHMPWQPVRITGDLLACWEFDNDENGAFSDSSPNNCRLTSNGVVLEAGRNGKVLRCGEGGATCSVPDAFFSPRGVTVALWCKPSEKDQSDSWMLNTVSKGTEGYRLGFGGGHPIWQVPRESWSHSLKGPDSLPADEWAHVAATFDNCIMRLYVNGKEVATLERRGFINPGSSITVGAYSADMKHAQFRGWLDDVQVYRRVLSAEEIAALSKTQ